MTVTLCGKERVEVRSASTQSFCHAGTELTDPLTFAVCQFDQDGKMVTMRDGTLKHTSIA